MVRRLLLSLLIIWLAVPAIAMTSAATNPREVAGACHEPPAAPPSHHDETDGMRGAKALHGCIGCVAPLQTGIATPECAAPKRSYAVRPLPVRSSHHAVPETPPPRIA